LKGHASAERVRIEEALDEIQRAAIVPVQLVVPMTRFFFEKRLKLADAGLSKIDDVHGPRSGAAPTALVHDNGWRLRVVSDTVRMRHKANELRNCEIGGVLALAIIAFVSQGSDGKRNGTDHDGESLATARSHALVHQGLDGYYGADFVCHAGNAGDCRIFG